jgi:hypothetical protein
MGIARNLSQLADNITSNGILNKEGGGTGTATPAIVAGTNITVSGTWPNQTISFSGVRSASTTSDTIITPSAELGELYTVTSLGTATNIAPPSGTPIQGQKLIIRIKDNGTARSLNWTTGVGAYRVIGTVLPTVTVANKTVYIGCIYNATDTTWDVVSVAQQG